MVCPSFVSFGVAILSPPCLLLEGCTVLFFSAWVMILLQWDCYCCAINVPFVLLYLFVCLELPCGVIVQFPPPDCLIPLLWFNWGRQYVADSSIVSRVCSGLQFFPSSEKSLTSVAIFEKQIIIGFVVVTRMLHKRGQNYTDRVNKGRRAIDSSATLGSLVQPEPSRPQPVQSQEPTSSAPATTQITQFYLSSSIGSTVKCCSTTAICSSSSSNGNPIRASYNVCSSGSSPRGAICSGSHFTLKLRG